MEPVSVSLYKWVIWQLQAQTNHGSSEHYIAETDGMAQGPNQLWVKTPRTQSNLFSKHNY